MTLTSVPITTKAYLSVMDNGRLRATLHNYTHSARETRTNADGSTVLGTVHWYRCSVTGQRRTWGFDDL